MPHPMRMCRLSDNDLYCVAMKILRRPELMELLSAKSMMRYGPPKYTAGFARSFVSGKSRSPAPPASTMTMLSSSSVDMAWSSVAPQHDARGRAVGPDNAQRQAEHVVDARRDVAQVQPFDHDRAGAEEYVVRRRAGRLEHFDRQIIDADHLHAAFDEVPRARFGDADVVGVELRRAPQLRVPRFDQQADIVREMCRGEIVGGDGARRRHLDHPRDSGQQIQRPRVESRLVVEKMTRRVHV